MYAYGPYPFTVHQVQLALARAARQIVTAPVTIPTPVKAAPKKKDKTAMFPVVIAAQKILDRAMAPGLPGYRWHITIDKDDVLLVLKNTGRGAEQDISDVTFERLHTAFIQVDISSMSQGETRMTLGWNNGRSEGRKFAILSNIQQSDIAYLRRIEKRLTRIWYAPRAQMIARL